MIHSCAVQVPRYSVLGVTSPDCWLHGGLRGGGNGVSLRQPALHSRPQLPARQHHAQYLLPEGGKKAMLTCTAGNKSNSGASPSQPCQGFASPAGSSSVQPLHQHRQSNRRHTRAVAVYDVLLKTASVPGLVAGDAGHRLELCGLHGTTCTHQSSCLHCLMFKTLAQLAAKCSWGNLESGGCAPSYVTAKVVRSRKPCKAPAATSRRPG
jgi:hypothetical protein